MSPATNSGNAAEIAQLEELESRPFLPRLSGYLRWMGPGYLQSAMTLGGGSAFAAIFSGAAFGYQLLWVAPLGMLLGVIVLSAVAHQTLSTDEDPYQALKERAHPLFAYAFAWGGLLSSVVWQFAQYALASAMIVLLAGQLGIALERWQAGLVALAWCVAVTALYGSGSKVVRLYETVLKFLVWGIVMCFAFVVVRTGVPEPGQILSGFVPSLPGDFKGVSAKMVIVSGLAAAVGANMLFVYPYTLRRRGWGKSHRRLARYDLIFGMLLPFSVAVTLMVVANAAVFHYLEPELFAGKKIAPDQVARIFADPERLGEAAGLWAFGLGILAMALSSITMQMLASGYACAELFGWREGMPLFQLGRHLPAIGVLGAVFWGDMVAWVPVPTNILSGLLLPAAYLGFLVLHGKRSYLGDATPSGIVGTLWKLGMLTAVGVLLSALGTVAVNDLPGFLERLGLG